MSKGIKGAIVVIVVTGILYVLISPLPEVDATYSGKSALSYFALVFHAQLGLFVLASPLRFLPINAADAFHGKVLDLLCVHLC